MPCCAAVQHQLNVLEDNAEILNSLTRLLRSWGAEVVPSTGYNAQLIKRISMHERIDAIIADHNLGPHSISGVEAVFKIRELVGMPVPIIMLTAVQRGEVVNEFQRVMQEHLLADRGRRLGDPPAPCRPLRLSGRRAVDGRWAAARGRRMAGARRRGGGAAHMARTRR